MNGVSNYLTMSNMKKLYIIMMLVLTGTMAFAQTSVWSGGRQIWTRGEGTESAPFLIESAENLAYLAYVVNKGYDTQGVYFRLTTDIDLNGSEEQQWVPIGLGNRWFNEDGCERGVSSTSGIRASSYFRGHFDGGEHSISNIFIVDSLGLNLGLFGCVQMGSEDVTIENVFVINGYIRGRNSIGGIVGQVTGAGSNNTTVLISRCWSGVTLERSSINLDIQNGIGGIVGYIMSGETHIQKCYNVGNLSGYIVGGILGGGRAEIEECFNKGDVTGAYAGGIYGYLFMGEITINNCYNLGEITANDDHGGVTSGAPAGPAAGGIAGAKIRSNGNVTVTYCYNAGNVSSTKDMGCIMAYAAGTPTFENNAYLNTCSDENEGQGTPLSIEYMRSQEYVDFLNGGNRDQIWAMDVDNINDGFPILTEVNYINVPEQHVATFSVYPNPTQDQFTVEGTGLMVVNNLLGQQVLSRRIEGKVTVRLPKGMYIIRLNNSFSKIVVE